MGATASDAHLDGEYRSFFEHAERTRRWRMEEDVPWDLAESVPRDPALAAAAEAFVGMEMRLPDYVFSGLDQVRDRAGLGHARFLAGWAYEESRHALVLAEYLRRTGQRTEAELEAYQRRILAARWSLPLSTMRQMTIYGALQEMTTFASYRRQRAAAAQGGDALLTRIYDLVARDEMAHAGFYIRACRLLLDEDGEGTRADLAHVFHHFRMPALEVAPLVDVGLDRAAFCTEVWLPLLRRLDVDRRALPPPCAPSVPPPPRSARVPRATDRSASPA